MPSEKRRHEVEVNDGKSYMERPYMLGGWQGDTGAEEICGDGESAQWLYCSNNGFTEVLLGQD